MTRIFFPDGTHEDRPDNCPLFGAKPNKHPRAAFPDARGFGLGCQGYAHHSVGLPATECRRDLEWWAYRLTDGFGEGEQLRGRWEPVRIESHQAERERRLAAERDVAVAALRKIAGHNATSRWSPEKQCSVDQNGEPWRHWADIARDALVSLGEED